MMSSTRNGRAYDRSHASNLHGSDQAQEAAQHLPADDPLLAAAGDDDDEGERGHALEHDGEGHEEADAAPQAAEVAVQRAVGLLREGLAGGGQRAAARVQAVGVVHCRAGELLGENRRLVSSE